MMCLADEEPDDSCHWRETNAYVSVGAFATSIAAKVIG
ncbi:hypothetical protein N183_27710 [Sinorhizobium sp. Sb3]|nr:hypothetical protein N183_27710 [Sinorhizobium sp. Sb3]